MASISAMMGATREGADLRVIVGFMSFLATWFHEFPVAVKHFLSESSNFPFVSLKSSHLHQVLINRS